MAARFPKGRRRTRVNDAEISSMLEEESDDDGIGLCPLKMSDLFRSLESDSDSNSAEEETVQVSVFLS